MTEFSRGVFVDVIKDQPKTREEFETRLRLDSGGDLEADVALVDARYERYLHYFQPHRWVAKAANGETVARGESYYNEADCIDNVALNYGDDTTVFWRSRDPERGNQPLRRGKSDIALQAPPKVLEIEEHLAAAPIGAIVRSNQGTIACRYDAERGVVFGDDRTFFWHALELPAVLIWTPTEGSGQ